MPLLNPVVDADWMSVQGMSGTGSHPFRNGPRCRRCSQKADARTPGGLRCLDHAVEEYILDLKQGTPRWIPKLLPHARAGFAAAD